MLKAGVNKIYRKSALLYNLSCKSHTKCNDLVEDKFKYRSIKESYSGKTIFLTGGTGFVGKVLIEKLLRSTDVEKIYVLIREKRGVDCDKRLRQMLNVPVFEKLKETKPEALDKLVAVGGDVTLKGLGITPEDEEKIIDNVSLVIHSAATVKFVNPLSYIMNINYEGTKRMVKLSKRIKNLETFLYISTAFCQADKVMVDEVMYPPHCEADDVYKFIDTYGDNSNETFKLLDGQPNTYTLSKSLCESYVQDEHKPMSTIVLRPAAVTPAYKEPVPGWVDSWVATTGLYSDMARGLTKVMYTDNNVICDMIPVDYVTNLAIVAGARGNKANDILVLNSSSSTVNPITWKVGADLYLEESLKHGKSELKPSKMMIFTSPVIVNLLSFALQTTPAFVADVILRIKGEKPKYLKLLQRAVTLRDILRIFSNKSLQFKSNNVEKLYTTLSKEDKIEFQFDPKTIVWRKYMRIFYRGVQKYMLNK